MMTDPKIYRFWRQGAVSPRQSCFYFCDLCADCI
jgi:hypothetical protein